MPRVIVTKEARKDLIGIRDYLRDDRLFTVIEDYQSNPTRRNPDISSVAKKHRDFCSH